VLNTSAYSLEDLTLDHGNFLELILLLSKYDPCLQGHVSECIEKSKKLHEGGQEEDPLLLCRQRQQ